MKKTSNLSLGYIWFGAGVSIAEILTGASIAPLGFARGLTAIIIGHLIGCVLMYLIGVIGAERSLGSMDSVKLAFGRGGGSFFSGMNVLQLVGWTAVMIASGASAASSVLPLGGAWAWCLVIGVLIVAWCAIGERGLNAVNTVAVAALLILTVILSFIVFRGEGGMSASEGGLSFGAAVELSVAMPLSWLPLISDYTKNAKKPKSAPIVATAVYFTVSTWMYVIGMASAIFTGESDVAIIMVKAGLSIAGLVTVIFSTVTTTYLDVFSSGASIQSMFPKLNAKAMGLLTAVLGTVIAIFADTGSFESFLYLIGSVFAPMAAIQIADTLILKNDSSAKKLDVAAVSVWAAGFVFYRFMMRVDTPLGSTLPVMAATALLLIAVRLLICKNKKKK